MSDYKCILAAVNEHLNSEVAAGYAIAIARASKARLVIAHAAQKGVHTEARQKAEAAVQRLFNHALTEGLKAESIIVSGQSSEEIPHIAATENVDLLVAATRRQEVGRRLYLSGSSAQAMAARLKCAAALVRVVQPARGRPAEILVPLKAHITRLEERAAFTALLAAAYGARVFVFHVTKPATRFLHGTIHRSPSEWEAHISPDMHEFIRRLKSEGIKTIPRLLPGSEGGSITIEAATKRHDLIIMGASERNIISSTLRGNPLEETLRNTPCNLIIFKPAHENPYA